MLEARELRVSYGNIRALHGVSVNVEAGEVVTLIGANGAGKSTFLKNAFRFAGPAVGTDLL